MNQYVRHAVRLCPVPPHKRFPGPQAHSGREAPTRCANAADTVENTRQGPQGASLMRGPRGARAAQHRRAARRWRPIEDLWRLRKPAARRASLRPLVTHRTPRCHVPRTVRRGARQHACRCSVQRTQNRVYPMDYTDYFGASLFYLCRVRVGRVVAGMLAAPVDINIWLCVN